MGCGQSREFVNFTNTRISLKKDIYYLSELVCEWVWGTEGHDIYKWARDKELIVNEDYRCVPDMIRLCKKLRKHRGDTIFSEEERQRYLLFITICRKNKIGRHTINSKSAEHTNQESYDYLVVQ